MAMLSASPRQYPNRSPRQGAALGGQVNLNYPQFTDEVRVQKILAERAALPKEKKPSPRLAVAPPSKRNQKPVVTKKSLHERWGEALDKKFGSQVSGARIFERLDRDRSGALTHEEALKSILALSLDVTEEEIQELMIECDTNGDGEIDFHEFREGIDKLKDRFRTGSHAFGAMEMPRVAHSTKIDLGAHTGQKASGDEIDRYLGALRDAVDTKYKMLRKAFQSVDVDRSNSLTKHEIREIMRNFALPIPMNHVDQIFDMMDKNSDGTVSYVEFCDLVKQQELGGGKS